MREILGKIFQDGAMVSKVPPTKRNKEKKKAVCINGRESSSANAIPRNLKARRSVLASFDAEFDRETFLEPCTRTAEVKMGETLGELAKGRADWWRRR